MIKFCFKVAFYFTWKHQTSMVKFHFVVVFYNLRGNFKLSLRSFTSRKFSIIYTETSNLHCEDSLWGSFLKFTWKLQTFIAKFQFEVAFYNWHGTFKFSLWNFTSGWLSIICMETSNLHCEVSLRGSFL